MELSQIVALAIFIAMFIAIIIGKVHRFIPALIGAALTLIVVFLTILKSPQSVFTVLNLGQLGQSRFWLPGKEQVMSHGINWQTIIFIGGMMVMVESMGEVGFFEWLCRHVAKMVNYKVIPILISFMLLAGFLAMFIDSITVLLFMAAIVIELSHLLKFDPAPVIIAMIFAANTGGAATMSGDPPNIIIGTALGYTFIDFAVNTGLIAWAGMLLSLGFFYFAFRKTLFSYQTESNSSTEHYPEPKEAISNPFLFKINTAIFILIVALIVTHATTGLSVALIGTIAAVLTLATAYKKAPHIIKRVDWRTLLFFIGLFITVGGLEETGLLKMLAEYIGKASGSNILFVIPVILWISAVASAIIDNIPFAATMVPVISSLSQTTGLALPPMAWTLALGTDIGGNATPIGASANVVGLAIAEKEGHPISWRQYCKYAIPATIMVVSLFWLLLIIRYG
ncbi:MAG: citrate transporter [Chloroflexi bacterium]|nr:citrate transporter [Chloroflexota bacterium]